MLKPELIDSVQTAILRKKRGLRYDRDYNSTEVFVMAKNLLIENMKISKEYLVNATGIFKEHLEEQIRRGERLLANMETIQFKIKNEEVSNNGLGSILDSELRADH